MTTAPNGPDCLLRTARGDDIGAIQTLLAMSDLPHADLVGAQLSDFLVAECGDELAGTIGLEIRGTDALLRSLAVDPRRRRNGIGERLLNAIEAAARRRGVKHLYLLTTTASSFFEHHGYARCDRGAVPATIAATTEFASLCPASAICMNRLL